MKDRKLLTYKKAARLAYLDGKMMSDMFYPVHIQGEVKPRWTFKD